MARDWVGWHAAYDDPDSPLSRRLDVVSRMVRDVLDAAPPGPFSVLSLCAGDGRDLLAGAAGHRRANDLSGVLVELEPELAAVATENMALVGGDLAVTNADAGDPDVYRAVLPVDLLLLCGIFGNVADVDVRATIDAVPALCRPGATVIWTRHRRAPDRTPSIRTWFEEAGCTHAEFVSPDADSFAVGRERFTDASRTGRLPNRLFTFADDR